MTVLRRSVVAGIGAASVMLPFGLQAAKRPAPPQKGVWAVAFDGKTVLKNDGPPSSWGISRKVFLAYWYNSAVALTFNGVNHAILRAGIPASGNGFDDTLTVDHGVRVQGGKPFVQILMAGPKGNSSFAAWGGPLVYDGLWHLLLIALSADTGFAKATHDLIPLPLTVSTNGSNQAVQWGGRQILIGSSGKNARGVYQWTYKGSLAGFYCAAPADDIDPTSPQIMEGFVNPNSGLPVDIDGTGKSALPGTSPLFFLDGPTTRFPINLSQAAPDAETSTWADTAPSSNFYADAGSLKVPATDPWGFVGV